MSAFPTDNDIETMYKRSHELLRSQVHIKNKIPKKDMMEGLDSVKDVLDRIEDDEEVMVVSINEEDDAIGSISITAADVRDIRKVPLPHRLKVARRMLADMVIVIDNLTTKADIIRKARTDAAYMGLALSDAHRAVSEPMSGYRDRIVQYLTLEDYERAEKEMKDMMEQWRKL